METCFEVDGRSYYDIGSVDDLKDLWESDDLDPTMQDVLRLHPGENIDQWTFMEAKNIPGLILNDRLMTDAALGTRPIKTEHSYSLASDGDSNPDSPNSRHVDEMEEECYPAIKMNTACDRMTTEDDDDFDDDRQHCVEIKEEDLTENYGSETDSMISSCPPSPQPQQIQIKRINENGEICLDVDMSTLPHFMAAEGSMSNLILTAPQTTITNIPQRIFPAQRILPKYSLKIENPNNSAQFHLPPTPPSCTSSDDSEDNATISQPSSPAARKNTTKVIMGTRNPIHTPLISQQPKGSIGNLVLTEEEKRTLIAEGYPIPTRLPLTKAEEKSLKKIRRKIKNKISAQESRRKKKEYMDQLEKKVDNLVNENQNYKKKINNLEDSNKSLIVQLQKLQALVAKSNPQLLKQLQNSESSSITYKQLPTLLPKI